MSTYDSGYGGRTTAGTKPKGSGGAPAGEPSVIEWDSDLADTAAFLALLEFDAAASSGITEAQADGMYTVTAGEVEIDSRGATDLGADVDFVYRAWFTGLMLPQADADIRCERGANHGTDLSAPLGLIRLAWFYFLNAAAANPSTPADFGTYSDSWTGFQWPSSTGGSFRQERGIWDSTPTGTILSLFQRMQARVNRALETAGSTSILLNSQTGSSYASTLSTVSTSDATRAAGTVYDEARRVRFAIEINPGGLSVDLSDAALHRMNIKVPRLRLAMSPAAA